MNYENLHNSKSAIFNLVEDTIILNFKVEYRLSGIIACPSFNHYNAIIFNPFGCKINTVKAGVINELVVHVIYEFEILKI